MNKSALIVLAFFAAATLGSALSAQTPVSLDPEAGLRVSATLDKKLAKGLHLSLQEEARLDNNFSAFDRLHTTLAVSYKTLPFLKVGAGYAFIAPFSASKSEFKNPRHRLMLDAQLSRRMGGWTLSLKERLQATLRTGQYNPYQNPAVALTLKSRIKLRYNNLRRLTPYASLEMRTYLNAPVVTAATDGTLWYTTDGSQEGESGWFLDGFDGIHNNRYRATLGADYRIDRRNTLGLYLMADWVADRILDANAEGTKLKSYTLETGQKAWIGVEYKYSL